MRPRSRSYAETSTSTRSPGPIRMRNRFIFPGGVAEHLVAVVETDAEHAAAEALDDLALHLDLLFLDSDGRSFRALPAASATLRKVEAGTTRGTVALPGERLATRYDVARAVNRAADFCLGRAARAGDTVWAQPRTTTSRSVPDSAPHTSPGPSEELPHARVRHGAARV